MHQEHLAALIREPEVQRMILGGYRGYYSLGLTLNPSDRGGLAISVRVQGEHIDGIARQVTLEGQLIPVVVHPNFQMPVAR